MYVSFLCLVSISVCELGSLPWRTLQHLQLWPWLGYTNRMDQTYGIWVLFVNLDPGRGAFWDFKNRYCRDRNKAIL